MRGRFADRQGGFIAVGLVAVLAGTAGVGLLGRGAAGTVGGLLDGGAWLSNTSAGTVSHVSGIDGRMDTELDARMGSAPFHVIQRPDGAYVVNDTTGAVSRVDAATQTVTTPSAVLSSGSGARVALAVGGGKTWEVDRTAGLALQVDPLTLAPIGSQVRLGKAPVGAPVADGQGTLWAPVPGAVDELAPGGQVVQTAMGPAGDGVAVTVADGKADAVDVDAKQLRALPSGSPIALTGTPLSWNGGVPGVAAGVLVAGNPDSAQVVVVDGAGLEVADVDAGTVRSIPVAATTGIAELAVSGTHAYLLDEPAGTVRVVDLESSATGTPPGLIALPSEKVGSLTVKDGKVFANDPTGAGAVVIDADGTTTVMVTKYTAATTQVAKTAPPVLQRSPSAPLTSLPTPPAAPSIPDASAFPTPTEGQPVTYPPAGGTVPQPTQPTQPTQSRQSTGLDSPAPTVSVGGPAGGGSPTPGAPASPSAGSGRHRPGEPTGSAPRPTAGLLGGRSPLPGLPGGGTPTLPTANPTPTPPDQPSVPGPSLPVAVPSVAPPPVPPAQPNPPVVTGSDSTLAVTWQAPDDNGSAIDGYQVSLNGDVTMETTTSHTFTGLTNGSNYCVTVQAHNVAGNGPSSSQVCVSPSQDVPGAVPSATATLNTDPQSDAVHVTWTAAPDGQTPVTGYTITATASDGSPAPAPATVAANVLSYDYANGTLTKGGRYTFSIAATNAKKNAGPAADSNDVVVMTQPSAVSNLTATTEYGDVLLAWDQADTGGDSVVYDVTVDGQAYSGTPSGTSETVDLKDDSGHTFGVTAVNHRGKAAAMTATGNAGQAPSSASGLVWTPGPDGSGNGTLSWTAASDQGGPNDQFSYLLNVSGGNYGGSANGYTATETGTSHYFDMMPAAGTYTFTVQPQNIYARGPASRITGSTTAAAAPQPVAPGPPAPAPQQITINGSYSVWEVPCKGKSCSTAPIAYDKDCNNQAASLTCWAYTHSDPSYTDANRGAYSMKSDGSGYTAQCKIGANNIEWYRVLIPLSGAPATAYVQEKWTNNPPGNEANVPDC